MIKIIFMVVTLILNLLAIASIPFALLYSFIREKLDPEYKERVENAVRIRKGLEMRGLNDSMIDDITSQEDHLLKSEQKSRKIYGDYQ